MAKRFLLEISVGSVERAVAAERGGADRIELCADLSVGGLTPSRELLRAVRVAVRIPVFSMIRPREGDFVYSQTEFAEMRRAIAVAQECGMDGVVLGVLHRARKVDWDRRVDVGRTRELVELARPLPVTFHRAFDECYNAAREGAETEGKHSGDECGDPARQYSDLEQALQDVIQTGATRILTSGGAKSALEGASTLAKLIAAAGDPIAILPGAGISGANITEVVRRTGGREFHSGLSTELPYSSPDSALFESEVARLARKLADVSDGGRKLGN